MPAQKTKKTNLEDSKVSEKKVVSKNKSKKNVKKDTEKEVKKDVKKELNRDAKKVVVKRRKTDLKPTKASAIAIVSQANRAKKQALIEKMANSDVKPVKKSEPSDTKIPLWVWIFFGCSLLIFCISFYKAIIYPQLEAQVLEIPIGEDIKGENDGESNIMRESNVLNDDVENHNDTLADDSVLVDQIIDNPQNPEELIQSFFAYMSDGRFDESFALFDSTAQSDPKIKGYFGAFKMQPFFEGIEGKSIVPQNIYETAGVYKGKNIYKFDISYILESTHEQFDETWEFVPSNYGGEWRISRIYCVSSKCGNHPIFGPEDFGLMR